MDFKLLIVVRGKGGGWKRLLFHHIETSFYVFTQGEKNKIRSSLHQKGSIVITNAIGKEWINSIIISVRKAEMKTNLYRLSVNAKFHCCVANIKLIILA
nr:MAG TPA: hypothetical protein [Caudoviricetes sp.]